MRRPVRAAAAVAVAAPVAACRLGPAAWPAAEVASGGTLCGEHCASRHGRNPEGQPDRKARTADGRMPAPRHDASGHRWHHPDRVLSGITKLGRKPFADEDRVSAMTAFAAQPGDREGAAAWANIKPTSPARERACPAGMTRPDVP